MKISDRIRVICNTVAKGETVADIGTDHAYVPLILYKDLISPDVIMCDISEYSLEKARRSFKSANIEMPDNSFRVGNGIEVIKPGEVDDIVIAGLGGATIVEILKNNIEKLSTFKKLILQPRNNSSLLRAFLFKHNIEIVSEELVIEGKFICEVIVADPSELNLYASALPYEIDDIRWKFNEKTLKSDRKLLLKKIIRFIDNHNDEIKSLKKSNNDYSDRIYLLQKNLNYLMELQDKIDG